MGVAGCGKSTIARRLAARLKIEFLDADAFHSKENIEKMSRGIALTDADREPWLNTLREAVELRIAEGRSATLACSALKRKYRQVLTVDSAKQCFVYLRGSQTLFESRLAHRKQHFMKSDMLKSQFETLEEPGADEAIICDAGMPVMQIVGEIIKGLPDNMTS